LNSFGFQSDSRHAGETAVESNSSLESDFPLGAGVTHRIRAQPEKKAQHARQEEILEDYRVGKNPRQTTSSDAGAPSRAMQRGLQAGCK
jgi:hypothetical protein